jgi:hypothetical protein
MMTWMTRLLPWIRRRCPSAMVAWWMVWAATPSSLAGQSSLKEIATTGWRGEALEEVGLWVVFLVVQRVSSMVKRSGDENGGG